MCHEVPMLRCEAVHQSCSRMLACGTHLGCVGAGVQQVPRLHAQPVRSSQGAQQARQEQARMHGL